MKKPHRKPKNRAGATLAAAALTVTLAGPCIGSDYTEGQLQVVSVVTSSLRPDPATIAKSLLGTSAAITAVGGTAGQLDTFGQEGAETDVAAIIDADSQEESSLPKLYERLHGLVEKSAESDSLAAALDPLVEKLALRIASLEDAAAEKMLNASRAFWAGIDQELEAIRNEKAALLARA